MATASAPPAILSRRQSLTLALGAGAATLLYGSGLIGAGAALAATKDIPGIGIRLQKKPGGSGARVRAVASDAGGRFNLVVQEAGDQAVDIDKAALQMTVNAEAAATPVGAAERIVIVRFAPRLRVTGPGGQAAVPGQPGTFILSSGVQTFVVANMAAGSEISGELQTVDLADLFPGAAQDVAASANRSGRTPPRFQLPRGNFGMNDRMIPRNDINPLPRPSVSGQ